MSAPEETNSGRQVAQSSIFYLGSQLGARALNFVFFIMLARSLPTAEFGILNFALTFIVFLDIVIDLGLSRYALREISKFPDQTGWFIGTLLPFKLCASVVVYGLSCVLILYGSDFGDNGLIFVVAVLSILFTAPSMLFESVLQAHQKFSIIAMAHVGLSVTQFVIGVVVLLSGGSTLIIGLVFSVSNLFYCSLMIYGVRKIDLGPFHFGGLVSLGQLLKPAFPYLCSALIVILVMRAEFLILGYFGSAEDLGLYGMATKILEAALLLPVVFGTVLAPRFAIAHARPMEVLTKLYGSSVEVLLLMVIPCALLAYSLAPVLVWILPDRGFAQLDSVLKLLFLGYPAACLYLLNTFVLFGAVKQSKPLILLIALALLQVTINAVLQNGFGLWGAAYSFLGFMSIAAFASTFFILNRFVELAKTAQAFIAPGTGLAVVALIYWLMPASMEMIRLTVALASYAAVVFMTRRLLPGGARQFTFET
ncbi:oligosaccharide flippase family protein [Sneathiella sp.]|jgi:O-antigen/teichoic acid export membrane protein|uniref:oligosaccharide flippase family protein n=1 Tax=Sneathiella sp. TaxID=1964365 RepID=UPI0039E5D56A